jgi:periplasmic divalent cation tolerance protein
MKDDVLLVFCTTPDSQEADRIAHVLIHKKLAACCNILPKTKSIYWWQGNIKSEEETLILIKTLKRKYEQLEKEIKMVHSYSVPEIIATPITHLSQAYLDWVIDTTTDTF